MFIDREEINAWVEPGSHIIDVLCEAKERVDLFCAPMKFEFNGTTVIFYPGKKVNEVYLAYMDQMGGDMRGVVKK